MLKRTPIYITLDKERELAYNLNTAILLRDAGLEAAPLVQETGEEGGQKTYRVNLDTLRYYLWAGLQKEARRDGERLTLEDVGEMIGAPDITRVLAAVNAALSVFYGDAQGEASAQASSAKAQGVKAKRGHGKTPSASSAER